MDPKRLINHPDFIPKYNSELYRWQHYEPWTVHWEDACLTDLTTLQCFMCFTHRVISGAFYGSEYNSNFWEKFS